MASLKSVHGDDRVAIIEATWPVDVPEDNITAGDSYPLEEVSKLWFTVKRSVKDTDEDAVFQKTYPAGGVEISGSEALVAVGAEDVQTLLPEKDTKLVYEVQVLTADDKVWTVDSGEWTFTKQITRSDT